MTRELTQKEKQAVEALQGARREGCSLRAYAKRHKLTIQILYNTIARLRKQGLLAQPAGNRPGKSVAVRGEAHRMKPRAREEKVSRESVVCRIVHPRGYLIECTQWPPLDWLESLSGNSTRAAAELHNGSGETELRDS